MPVYIGLDIGGTKFMAAAADAQGNILRRTRAATSTTLEEDLDNLNRMITELSEGDEILGMGAAVGGPLDWKSGVVSPLHQPAWRNVPLKEMMESRWGCPFCVDVDTNVAALGELWAEETHPQRFLYITLSTGMGGGFLVDGKVYRGAGGAHPEVGHQSIHSRCSYPLEQICECGIPDCLESLVSGNGIRRVYSKPAEMLTQREWDEVAYNFGQGLRNMATLYAPELIRVGGGVAVGGGPAFIERSAQVMRMYMKLVQPPKVELSKLGYDTALTGAIVLAIQGLES